MQVSAAARVLVLYIAVVCVCNQAPYIMYYCLSMECVTFIKSLCVN